MLSQHETSFVRRILLALCLTALVVGLTGRPAVAAEPLKKIDASLRLIPEDAAYYSAMFRNGEQIEAIAKSRAWKSVMAMPVVKQGLQALRAKIDENENAAQMKEAWENPEVQSALALLGDMMSHDVFICGDPASADCVDLIQQLVAAMRYGPALAQWTGQAEDLDPRKLNARMILSTLAENRDLIKISSTLIGFRVKDVERAKEAVVKLEMAINLAAVAAPQLSNRIKRTKVAGSSYLTISLDGGMVPWDKVPMDTLEDVEANEGDAQKVIDKLKTLKLVIALGVRNDYLLLSIGPSTDYLAKFGQGKSLAERAEFKPLEKFADRRLTGVSYLSKAMAAKVMNSPEDIDHLLALLNAGLDNQEGLSAGQKARIRKDAAALSKDLKRLMPVPGAALSFSFLTGQGMEGYSYNWGSYPQVGSSKPLTLLEHVGGHPLLMLVGRGKVSVADYDLLVHWLKVGYGYFEEFAVPTMQPSEREKFDKAVKAFRPLLKRANETNRTMLLPALADGQVGLAVDANLKSRQFIKSLPSTPQPMPMAQPALLFGVSNPELLRKAMAEYRAIFNASADALREISPEDVPAFKIPEPKVVKTAAGTIYWYPLPSEWGVTEEVKVVLGLSDRVAVVGATQTQVEGLLKTTPLAVGGVLTAADRARIGAVSLDWAGIVTAATPWAELVARRIIKEKFGDLKPAEKAAEKPKAAQKSSPATATKAAAKTDAKATAKTDAKAAGDKDKPKKAQAKKPDGKKKVVKKAAPGAEIMDQVRTVLKVLQVIRSATAETYREGNATVDHTMVEIRDIN